MKSKYIYIVFVVIFFQKVTAQDFSIKNENKVLVGVNPSFYGFGSTSKAGVVYGTEGYADGSKIENRFGFANHYF
jgi:hypothetical protein